MYKLEKFGKKCQHGACLNMHFTAVLDSRLLLLPLLLLLLYSAPRDRRARLRRPRGARVQLGAQETVRGRAALGRAGGDGLRADLQGRRRGAGAAAAAGRGRLLSLGDDSEAPGGVWGQRAADALRGVAVSFLLSFVFSHFFSSSFVLPDVSPPTPPTLDPRPPTPPPPHSSSSSSSKKNPNSSSAPSLLRNTLRGSPPSPRPASAPTPAGTAPSRPAAPRWRGT